MDKFDHAFIAPKDFDKSLAFYKNNLGWEVVSSWGTAPEPRGAVLKSDGGMTVIIAEEHEKKGDQAWDHGINGERPTLHLNVDDVDKRFLNLRDSTVAVIKPEKNHWGTKWFVLRDPDDNLIAFNQQLH